jgi:hypothetical protein
VKILQKIAEAIRINGADSSATTRTKALSRLGPPKLRFDSGISG